MTDSFKARTELKVGDRNYDIWSLKALPQDKVAKLPFSLKILLENLLRFEDGVNVTRLLERVGCGMGTSTAAGAGRGVRDHAMAWLIQ